MKQMIFFLSLAILVSGLQAAQQYRDFTNTKGQTIRGAVLGYDARTKTVTIERDNKRTAKVPISELSETDQTYILEWDAAKGFLSSSLLKISVDDKVVDKRKEKEVEDIQYQGGDVMEDFEKTVTTFESIAYEIEFQNRNKSELKNIRIEYLIYYEQSKMTMNENPKPELFTSRGKMEVPAVAAQSKLSVTTSPVEVYKESVNPIPVAGGDPRQGGKGEVLGIRLRIYMKMASGSEVMREMSSPDKLSEKKYPWKM